MEQWADAYRKKVIAPQDLEGVVKKIKAGSKRIATLNGSFDLMHAGHLQILYEASQTADILLVALNSDASIQAYKNPDRPIIPLDYRLQMLAAIGFVDYVTWFEETDPRKILSIIKPHVHVNGSEYGEDCIEADVVKSHGGVIHVAPLVPGLSTSMIISKIHSTSKTGV